MKVEIWSDIVCPWCYIGKRRFESALATFEHKDDIEVEWRSFELDPSAPDERELSLERHLAKKYGTTVEQARDMGARVTDAAAAEGIVFHLERARSGNTFRAHRLLHLAAQHGLGDALKERLMQAYFCEGVLPADSDALQQLAVEVGLDAQEVARVLASDAYTQEVRSDELRARHLGIRGVPFFLIDGKSGLSGAQPPEVLRFALQDAWKNRNPVPIVADADGCDDEGCVIPARAE